jgi:hypothetical protein
MKETQAKVLEQRAADVGQPQHLDAVAVLGPDMEVEVELLARAGVKK